MVVWLWFFEDIVSFQHLTDIERHRDRMLHVFIKLGYQLFIQVHASL